MRDADVVVVGGGVVGLAAAAALARAGRSLLLLERHPAFGRETTSRSSEVVHAGLYDPPGSAKAELCTAGREALYARCARLRIPHRRVGKWVVACDEAERGGLERLHERGRRNGVPDLRWLEPAEVRAREPAVAAVAALESPHTGIVDAAALCLSYAAEAEAAGALLVTRTELVSISRSAAGYGLETRGPEGEPGHVHCGAVVNAAGLGADAVAALAGLDLDRRGYRQHPCKGDYFALRPGAPLRVSRLVYPLPSGPGLGIHVTLDLAGRLRLGPDAHYVEPGCRDYRVDPGKAGAFAAAVGRYLPGLRREWLAPDFAGIRPRLAAPGEGFRDFVVAEESQAGLPGFVNCLGIESPGLTAAPAIAERVVALLGGL